MAGDVLIFAEHLERRIAPSNLEVIAIGRELASRSGGHVRVALFGEKVRALADALARHGVEVLLAEDPALAEYTPDGYGQAAHSVVESTRPRLILVAHTSQGYDLAPALAGTMDLPLVTNCLALRFDGEGIVATRRLLNEKVQADVEIASSRPIVATVRPGTAKAAGPRHRHRRRGHHRVRRPRDPEEREPSAHRGVRKGPGRRRGRIPTAHGHGLVAEDEASRTERQDGSAEALRGVWNQRRDATRRRHEGREPDHRHQHGSERTDLRSRACRDCGGCPEAPARCLERAQELTARTPGAFI